MLAPIRPVPPVTNTVATVVPFAGWRVPQLYTVQSLKRRAASSGTKKRSCNILRPEAAGCCTIGELRWLEARAVTVAVPVTAVRVAVGGVVVRLLRLLDHEALRGEQQRRHRRRVHERRLGDLD